MSENKNLSNEIAEIDPPPAVAEPPAIRRNDGPSTRISGSPLSALGAQLIYHRHSTRLTRPSKPRWSPTRT